MEISEADKLARLLESVKLHDRISTARQLSDWLAEIINEHAAECPVDLRKNLIDFIDYCSEHIKEEWKSPSDVKFYLDLLEIATSSLKRTVAEIDPYAKELEELFVGNGNTLESWCPEGFQNLAKMCENVVCIEYLPFFEKTLQAVRPSLKMSIS